MKVMERRFIRGSELRVDNEGDVKLIRGYAAVFDSMSKPLGGFREIIRKGAFKKTLRDGDVVALKNHDPNLLLARKSARTLTVWEDDKGLAYKINPPDTTYARDLMVSIERGDLLHSSFAFRVVPGKEKWSHPAGEELPVRELLQVELFDVSPVTNPAYQQTEVHVRAVMEAVEHRLHAGDVGKEERAAMALALDNLRSMLIESGEPRSMEEEAQDEPEPGQPHSSATDWREAVLAKRRRVMQLLGE